jgi:hypothetical protein
MFLKGLLFGIGFVVGMGIVTSLVLGVMALVHVGQNLAVIIKARKPQESDEKGNSHRAKMSFLVELPTKPHERMDLFEREAEYLQ